MKITLTALPVAIVLASGLAMAQTSGSASSGTSSGSTAAPSASDTTTPSTGSSMGTTGTTGSSAVTTTTSGTASISPLSEAEVENALMAAGYTEVSDISVTGEKFTATATKDGQTYEIDGTQSERAENATDVDEDQIKAQLEEKGYTDVSNVEKTGDTATAQATKDGEQVDLHADMSNGLVWQAKQGS